MLRLLACSSLLITAIPAFAGELFCEKDTRSHWDRISQENRANLTGNECFVAHFAGDIQEGDFQKVNDFFESNIVTYLFLDSNGGSLYEALRIGRLVRKFNLVTLVENGDGKVCNSSCFFVWAGGIYRVGNPWIHRPYIPDKSLGQTSMGTASEVYFEITTEIERFLSDLGLVRHLPSDFVSTMMATPPNDVFPLSNFEQRSPGLLSKFEPGVEQYILDKCGSLDNKDCMLNVFVAEAILRRRTSSN